MSLKNNVEGILILPSTTAAEREFIPCVPGKTSDGYHSFDDLYRHRCLLFCALIKLSRACGSKFPEKHFLGLDISFPWKSRKHHDGTSWNGWFIAGIELNGLPITYHLPESMWDLCPALELNAAPKWDGHTSGDVCDRIEEWLKLCLDDRP